LKIKYLLSNANHKKKIIAHHLFIESGICFDIRIVNNTIQFDLSWLSPSFLLIILTIFFLNLLFNNTMTDAAQKQHLLMEHYNDQTTTQSLYLLIVSSNTFNASEIYNIRITLRSQYSQRRHKICICLNMSYYCAEVFSSLDVDYRVSFFLFVILFNSLPEIGPKGT
jgi:hypothetical protein